MQERRWSEAEVRALPDEPGKRFEVVDGELLVSSRPSDRHQLVLSRLFAVIFAYVDAQSSAPSSGDPPSSNRTISRSFNRICSSSCH